jgi:hypothetical protein
VSNRNDDFDKQLVVQMMSPPRSIDSELFLFVNREEEYEKGKLELTGETRKALDTSEF